MKKIRVAVIGTGNICPAHLDGYLKYPELCEVKALCDIYPEKAVETAKKFNLKDVKIVKDYHDIMKMEDIDLVSLCVPPSLHCQIACDFLSADKNVISEKPMASSLEECDKMIAAEKKSKGKLAIISQNRFRTPMMRMKTLLDSGMLGKMEFARVNSMWWRGTNYYDLWWRGTWEKECGGCTINHAVHQIDILQWLVGVPLSVTSVMKNIAHSNSEVEDVSISILQYPGAIGEINASLETHDEKQEFHIDTANATVSIPWACVSVKQRENGFFDPNPEEQEKIDKYYNSLPEVENEGHPAEIKNVLDALNGKGSILVTGEEGRKAVQLICAIYKSATEHVTVELPLKKDDPFYRKDSMLKLVPRFYKKQKSVENFNVSDITLGNMGK